MYFRPRDDEGVDRIELKVVDRFKTSELSGDEWRYSVAICFYRKGTLVYEKRYGKMEWAVAALPYELMVLPEKVDIPLWGLDDKVCNQYGCSEPVVVVYRLKELYINKAKGLYQMVYQLIEPIVKNTQAVAMPTAKTT